MEVRAALSAGLSMTGRTSAAASRGRTISVKNKQHTHSSGPGRAVGERQPAAQVPGGFVRSLAVERHQGCRPAREARNLCAPLVFAHARHFNLVFATVDDFLETMNVHDCRPEKRLNSRPERQHSSDSGSRFKRKKDRRRTHRVQRPHFVRDTIQNKSGCPSIHRDSTNLAQLFHSLAVAEIS
jgi:hypothetical protein